MLDDVTKDMEEMQQLKDISDLHVESVENPLKHLGVTSYNLTARRFSTCWVNSISMFSIRMNIKNFTYLKGMHVGVSESTFDVLL